MGVQCTQNCLIIDTSHTDITKPPTRVLQQVYIDLGAMWKIRTDHSAERQTIVENCNCVTFVRSERKTSPSALAAGILCYNLRQFNLVDSAWKRFFHEVHIHVTSVKDGHFLLFIFSPLGRILLYSRFHTFSLPILNQ